VFATFVLTVIAGRFRPGRLRRGAINVQQLRALENLCA